MSDLPPCPKCNSPYTYEDGVLLICPECAHEWTPGAEDAPDDDALVIKDSVGNTLADGDDVAVHRCQVGETPVDLVISLAQANHD